MEIINNIGRNNTNTRELIDICELKIKVTERLWIDMNLLTSRFDEEFRINLNKIRQEYSSIEKIEIKLYEHFLERHFAGRVENILYFKEA